MNLTAVRRKSTHLRWIEEAEAKRVRQLALAQRDVSEPFIGIERAASRQAWFARLRELIAKGGSTSAGGERPCRGTETVFWAGPLFRPVNSRPATMADRVLATILFTDIVDSTKRAAEMGDWRWRALLDRHDEAVRRQIARFRGTEVKNLGDGFLVTFDAPARAVHCASVITEAVAGLGIAVRSGLHTGEIGLKPNDIHGIAVHVAARIASMASPGQPLVSSTVRDLAAGSGLVFQDRGAHKLRGLPDEIRLYSISGGARAGSAREQ